MRRERDPMIAELVAGWAPISTRRAPLNWALWRTDP
jgi:hypothetical protein